MPPPGRRRSERPPAVPRSHASGFSPAPAPARRSGGHRLPASPRAPPRSWPGADSRGPEPPAPAPARPPLRRAAPLPRRSSGRCGEGNHPAPPSAPPRPPTPQPGPRHQPKCRLYASVGSLRWRSRRIRGLDAAPPPCAPGPPILAGTRSPDRRSRVAPRRRQPRRSVYLAWTFSTKGTAHQRLERCKGLVKVVYGIDPGLLGLREVRLGIGYLDGVRGTEAEALLRQPQLLGRILHHLLLQARGLIGGLQIAHPRRDFLLQTQLLLAHHLPRVVGVRLRLIHLQLAAEPLEDRDRDGDGGAHRLTLAAEGPAAVTRPQLLPNPRHDFGIVGIERRAVRRWAPDQPHQFIVGLATGKL